MLDRGTWTRRSRQRGAVLMVALAVLTLLSLLAVSFAAVTRLEQAAASNHTEARRARLVALGGLHRALAELGATEFKSPLPTPAAPWFYANDAGTGPGIGVELGTAKNPSYKQDEDAFGSFSGILGGTFVENGDRYKLRIVEKSSKIDLNLPARVLPQMLDNLGRAIFQEMTGKVAEPFDPINGRGQLIVGMRSSRVPDQFETVDELLQILTEEERAAVEPFVGIGGRVDPTTSRMVGVDPADGIPRFEREPRAPVGINAAPKEVLIATIAGVAIEGSQPINFVDATRIADAIIARRSGPAGPFLTWKQFNDFVDTQPISVAQQRALKVNANPNLTILELNPDKPINVGYSKSQLTSSTTEFSFISQGVFEIQSLGLVFDNDGTIVAEQELVATVKIFDMLQITTQSQFENANLGSVGTITHPTMTEVTGPPSTFSGYVEVRPQDSVATNALVAGFQRPGVSFGPPTGGPGQTVFDLFPSATQGGNVNLSPVFAQGDVDGTDVPEDGGDLMADGLHVSSTKAHGLSYAPSALPLLAGEVDFWMKLDVDPNATGLVPVLRASQPMTATTGIQFKVEVFTNGTDLQIRSERLYYDHLAAVSEEPLPVPFTNVKTVNHALVLGSGVPNEWHNIRLEWSDGTDHALYIDGNPVTIQRYPASDGALLGSAPYTASFRFAGGEDETGVVRFRNVTLDDLEITDPATASGGGGNPFGGNPTQYNGAQRFTPAGNGVLAQILGAFPPSFDPSTIGTFSATIHVPTSYANEPLPADYFTYQLRLTIDGVQYSAPVGTDFIAPFSGQSGVTQSNVTDSGSVSFGVDVFYDPQKKKFNAGHGNDYGFFDSDNPGRGKTADQTTSSRKNINYDGTGEMLEQFNGVVRPLNVSPMLDDVTLTIYARPEVISMHWVR